MSDVIIPPEKPSKDRPANLEELHAQCYMTVPLTFSDAMARLSVKKDRTLSGRFILKGEDATIYFRNGRMFRMMNGKAVAKTHPFARFVRANKDGFLALCESLKEKGLELALITGRFLNNGPDNEPLFAPYAMILVHNGYVKLFNVFCPMFDWEQHAFPTQLATITLDTEPEAWAADMTDANTQMMKLIGNSSMFEGTYWFADDIRFQVS